MLVKNTTGLLDQIYRIDPDVILIDLENPSRDVLEQMFQVSRIVRRPIAMFVDQSDRATIEAAVDAGVSAYIVDGLKKERVKHILDLCISRFNAFARLQGELDRAKSELEARKVIDRAKGILMKLKGLSEEEAYALAAHHRHEREAQDCRRRAIGDYRRGAFQVSSTDTKLRIGFIPLADAAALIVAADKGFAAAEGLDVELVREVSWSNVRDKLNIGLFDAAHLIAPIAIASNLGIGHVKVPIVAPFGLGVNGNAITVTPALHAEMAAAADGDILDPMVSARALKRVVDARKAKGKAPLAFGMTFPFSTHNYHIRFWMAAGGVDPDEDVQLVVLPPPYMVDSLASGHVDGFCVGAPWNSVAVDLGIGVILHFVCEILSRAMEKLLAVRADWAEENPDALLRLVRAHRKAAAFIEDAANREEVAAILAAPNRIDVAAHPGRAQPGRCRLRGDPPHARRAHEGRARRHRAHRRALSARRAATAPRAPIPCRPRGSTRRWCAGARRRSRPSCWPPPRASCAPISTMPPCPARSRNIRGDPADGIGAFTGPKFDPDDIAGYLASWTIKRSG